MLDVFEFARSIGIPLLIAGPDGVPQFANASFNKALGLAPDFDWRGVAPGGVQLAGIDFRHLEERLQQAVASGVPQDFEIDLEQQTVIGAPPSSRSAIAARVSPLDLEHGGRHYLVALCPPASSAHRDELDLLRIQRGENLERLASGVAHEFNNLFTGIKGLTDLIKSEVDHSSEIFELAESIHETVDRGSRLIQQLSSFAREEPYSLRLTDVGEWLLKSRPLLELQLERGTRLDIVELAGGRVLLDSSRMDHALANLLHNSRDALSGKGIVRITVDRQDPELREAGAHVMHDQWLMIEVADSGPGIPERLASRVMEPFYTTKERGKATGLGLSTTVKIVEMHNGLMTVGKSAELGGAAIRIFLPLAEG